MKKRIYVRVKIAKAKRKKRVKIASRVLLFFLFITSIYVGIKTFQNWLLNCSEFKLRELRIEGVKYLTENFITKKLELKKGKPIFSYSLKAMEQSLFRIPQVWQAKVIRNLPDKIIIRIKERIPLCRVSPGEAKLYIDSEGVIFAYEAEVPDVILPEDGDLKDIAKMLYELKNGDGGLWKRILSIDISSIEDLKLKGGDFTLQWGRLVKNEIREKLRYLRIVMKEMKKKGAFPVDPVRCSVSNPVREKFSNGANGVDIDLRFCKNDFPSLVVRRNK